MHPHDLPKFDLPADFVIMHELPISLLQSYARFPCRIKACLFVLCTKGELSATVNFIQLRVKANDFVTLLPNSYIQIGDISDDIQLYVVGFSYEFTGHSNFIKLLNKYYYSIIQHPALPLPARISGLYEQYYRLLQKSCILSNLAANREMLFPVFSLILQSCARLYQHYALTNEILSNRDREICRKFITLALHHHQQEHSVAFYAQACNVTLPHFCSTIKRAVGRTALDIINHLLIANAKEHLNITDVPIKQIAFELGFVNPSHFNRFFRKHTGMTPQQYRKTSK